MNIFIKFALIFHFLHLVYNYYYYYYFNIKIALLFLNVIHIFNILLYVKVFVINLTVNHVLMILSNHIRSQIPLFRNIILFNLHSFIKNLALYLLNYYFFSNCYMFMLKINLLICFLIFNIFFYFLKFFFIFIN